MLLDNNVLNYNNFNRINRLRFRFFHFSFFLTGNFSFVSTVLTNHDFLFLVKCKLSLNFRFNVKGNQCATIVIHFLFFRTSPVVFSTALKAVRKNITTNENVKNVISTIIRPIVKPLITLYRIYSRINLKSSRDSKVKNIVKYLPNVQLPYWYLRTIRHFVELSLQLFRTMFPNCRTITIVERKKARITLAIKYSLD